MADGTVQHEGATGPRRTTGTGGWIYLGLLAVVAVALVVVGLVLEDRSDPATVAGVIQPVELTIRAERATVRLEGEVPSDEVRRQLLELAAARYGHDVVDALVVEPTSGLDGGVVHVAGTVAPTDPQPLDLRADIVAALMLRAGTVEVDAPPGEADGGAVAMDPASAG